MRKRIVALFLILGLAFTSIARADTLTAIARREEGARQQQTGTTLLYLAAANLILAAIALPVWLDPGSDEGDAAVVRQSTGMYLFTGAAITGSMFFSIGLPLYVHGRHLATPAPVTLSVGNPTGITLHF